MTLPTSYQEFIALSRYARWNPALNCRESWSDTVERYIDNIVRKVLDKEEFGPIIEKIRTYITELKVMPSMRSLMTAGQALDRDNTCGYNCAYLPIDDPKSFDEAMMILLCGTGVGYSVEAKYVNQLPEVPDKLFDAEDIIVVHDSKEGWAKAFRKLLAMLWSGEVPKWDLSKIRPSGTILKVFGGRASGPEPLNQLFKFTIETFRKAQGRKLTSLECHDIMCKVADIVVSGGVRRSAMISLSDLEDSKLRHAKSGDWWSMAPYRALANNSAVYETKPDAETFMQEWLALVASKSGERGIFARYATKLHLENNATRRDINHVFGVNPCSEIILRPYQLCNLTEVVIRAEDDEVSIKDKIEIATILGTIQSTFTNFPYLRKIWKRNTEEERLLGVSLTGIMDNKVTNNPSPFFLSRIKQHTIEVNRIWAEKLGIPQSTAITCVKPSGTVSQLVDSASGIHARHSDYYIRTVRCDLSDPITKFMIDTGIPNEPDKLHSNRTVVFSFPTKSPKGSITRNDMSALDQLATWKVYAVHWCEHKPSVTITVKDEEWVEVGAWVYKNFDICTGISFLPHTDHIYDQAPYQEITEDQYNHLRARMPLAIDWSKLKDYEIEDTTRSSQTFACSGEVCEVVDLTK